jgi:hypothetical protein
MKQFKVRIEFENGENFHAVEAWLQAENIIDAGNVVMNYFGSLGIDTSDVKKLIEIDKPRHRPDTYSFGYPTCDMGHPTRNNGVHVRPDDYEAHCS